MTPAKLTVVSSDAATPERPRGGQRHRYLELLLFLAFAQVLVVHVVPFVWYPATFPAVGIVYAVGASLLAGALDRSQHRAFPVVKRAVLRLLAPLWVFGALLVPAMIAVGWTNAGAGEPLEPVSVLKWVVPLTPPPASDLGHDLALPFWPWALSGYLWLLLLSPALLWLFRRWPKRIVAVPLAVLVLNAFGVVTLTGDTGVVALDLATFGTCWLLGFAHHDGALARMPLGVALSLGVVVYGVGVVAAYALPPAQGGPLPEQTPLAYGFLTLGLVLVLLRLHPLVHGRLGAHRFATGLVIAVSRRAVTLYLWGNASLSVSLYVVQAASREPWWPALPQSVWPALTLAVSVVPLLACVLCLGWVEDKASGRPARLRPWPATVDRDEGHRGRHRRGRWSRRPGPRHAEDLASSERQAALADDRPTRP